MGSRFCQYWISSIWRNLCVASSRRRDLSLLGMPNPVLCFYHLNQDGRIGRNLIVTFGFLSLIPIPVTGPVLFGFYSGHLSLLIPIHLIVGILLMIAHRRLYRDQEKRFEHLETEQHDLAPSDSN